MCISEEDNMDVPFTFMIDEKLKDKLEKIAVGEFRTMSSQLRMLIEEFVEKQGKKGKR